MRQGGPNFKPDLRGPDYSSQGSRIGRGVQAWLKLAECLQRVGGGQTQGIPTSKTCCQKICIFVVQWTLLLRIRQPSMGKSFLAHKSHDFYRVPLQVLTLRLREIGRDDLADKLSESVMKEKADAAEKAVNGKSMQKLIVTNSPILLDSPKGECGSWAGGTPPPLPPRKRTVILFFWNSCRLWGCAIGWHNKQIWIKREGVLVKPHDTCMHGVAFSRFVFRSPVLSGEGRAAAPEAAGLERRAHGRHPLHRHQRVSHFPPLRMV